MRYYIYTAFFILLGLCNPAIAQEQTIETAKKTLLLERDSLLLPRNETRGRVLVAAGKRVNYKDGIYILQSDLDMMKRYGYHKRVAPDNALKAKAAQLIAGGTVTEIGTFSYTQLPPANIKYYYLGKYKFDIPTFYYSNDGDRQHIQGHSADIAVRVYVITDIEESR